MGNKKKSGSRQNSSTPKHDSFKMEKSQMQAFLLSKLQKEKELKEKKRLEEEEALKR